MQQRHTLKKTNKNQWIAILFVALLIGPGLSLTFPACTAPQSKEKPTTELPTAEKSTPDAAPKDNTPADQGPTEKSSPPEQHIDTPKEAHTPDKAVEQTQPDTKKEAPPTEQPTREQPGDMELTKGECQKAAPRCPPGYGCRDDVTPALCHLSCDPEKPACPAGRLCLVQGTGAGICVQGQPAKKGSPCDLQNICEQSLVCVLTSPPKGTCYQRCTLKNLQCPSGELCFLAHSHNGACINGSPGQKTVGNKCTSTTECSPGLICFLPFQQTDKICAALCDSDHPCPQGKTCAPIDNAPKGSGACK